ncbi:hypothetical protein K7X08_026158 [Anisodus acutangulus]|uniref:Malectin-like domain-containing protein n=1 Tax=Anisodus acutangulus TaxID=402998 RepID=A0A9Q1N2F4_9SOLA|nr:hypothetical protein K7X08_026158 [Anisodus acutangulus]
MVLPFVGMFLILLCILPSMAPSLAELQTYTPDHITFDCGFSETEVLLNGQKLDAGLFSITAGPYILLRTSESTYSGRTTFVGYTVREFIMNVNGPALNVTFRPSVNISDSYAFVNKIEIISVAPNLYIRPDVLLPLVGQPTKLYYGNYTALETMHRVNIGGPSISADEDDTDMFRPWADETGYLISGDLSTTVHARTDIKYSSSVPAYIAPREVYATARVMQCKSPVNLTWSFPLDPGFCYLVRLHFFKITSSDLPPYVFQVYINSRMAEERACVSEWTNRARVPAYRDYVVNTSAHHNKGSPFIDAILLLELNGHQQEYYRRQRLTEKSNVYSFGVVLFEVFCARPAVLPMVAGREDEIMKQANLAQWALSSLENGTFHETIDPFLRGNIDPEILMTFTGIAVKCLADKGSDRPSMGYVIENLELALQQQESAADTQGNEDVMAATADVIVIAVDKHNSDATPRG